MTRPTPTPSRLGSSEGAPKEAATTTGVAGTIRRSKRKSSRPRPRAKLLTQPGRRQLRHKGPHDQNVRRQRLAPWKTHLGLVGCSGQGRNSPRWGSRRRSGQRPVPSSQASPLRGQARVGSGTRRCKRPSRVRGLISCAFSSSLPSFKAPSPRASPPKGSRSCSSVNCRVLLPSGWTSAKPTRPAGQPQAPGTLWLGPPPRGHSDELESRAPRQSADQRPPLRRLKRCRDHQDGYARPSGQG
jgi:hypothetical protein